MMCTMPIDKDELVQVSFQWVKYIAIVDGMLGLKLPKKDLGLQVCYSVVLNLSHNLYLFS